MMRQLLADFKFQLTTSQGGRQNIPFRSVLLMTFQLTTSRGGRPGKKTQHNPYNCISTHDLTKRSTEYYKSTSATELFQLTTSQGGRRHECTRRSVVHYFNSRPHEEVDRFIAEAVCHYQCHFNSRPHEEVDRHLCSREIAYGYFNSRPHEEVDQAPAVHPQQQATFQLTTSRGGRLLCHVDGDLIVHISTHDLTRRSTRNRWRKIFQKTHFNSRPHEEVDQ